MCGCSVHVRVCTCDMGTTQTNLSHSNYIFHLMYTVCVYLCVGHCGIAFLEYNLEAMLSVLYVLQQGGLMKNFSTSGI